MFKKFIVKFLFKKGQREVIWKALQYSEYRYRRHNRNDEAVAVRMVMEKVRRMIGKEIYTPQEVNAMVNAAVGKAVGSVSKKQEEQLKQLKQLIKAADNEIAELRDSLRVHAENNTALGKRNNELAQENYVLRKKLMEKFDEDKNAAEDAEKSEENAPESSSKEDTTAVPDEAENAPETEK